MWISRVTKASSQQPAAIARQAPPARPAPIPDDNAGFEAIFDGKALDNWDGDPTFWRAEDGTIVAESTPEKVVRSNTFLIWKGGIVRDFELKLEFKLSPTANSGIQYRSALMPEVSKWAMKGYQADMDGANNYTGMVYEERGRGFLAPRGQFARMAEGRIAKLISSLGESDVLKEFLKTGDWNQMHVIARGNVLLHFVNGHLMAGFIDEDSQGRAMEGLLGLQMHAGKPMKIEFRSLYLKNL
ncbi:MAG: DUF1080 domain-containing protein [Acidobacteria bacterium]|nr:DUF1080 domain-containing protein [Acidobacteriota bacterium]